MSENHRRIPLPDTVGAQVIAPCGCGSSTPTVRGSCGLVVPMVLAERAAACLCCGVGWCAGGAQGVRTGCASVAHSCPSTGKPRLTMLRLDCPRGRFPDAQGRVKWRGVLWRGLPAPWRWRLAAGGWNPDRLAGCGCIIALKRFVIRLAVDWRGGPRSRITRAAAKFWEVAIGSA